jgi:hypothetical protein
MAAEREKCRFCSDSALEDPEERKAESGTSTCTEHCPDDPNGDHDPWMARAKVENGMVLVPCGNCCQVGTLQGDVDWSLE